MASLDESKPHKHQSNDGDLQWAEEEREQLVCTNRCHTLSSSRRKQLLDENQYHPLIEPKPHENKSNEISLLTSAYFEMFLGHSAKIVEADWSVIG